MKNNRKNLLYNLLRIASVSRVDLIQELYKTATHPQTRNLDNPELPPFFRKNLDYGERDSYLKRREELSDSAKDYNAPRTGKGKKRWSVKYKKKINCSNPKGFSQKQYCKRRRRGGKYKTAQDLQKARQELEMALLPGFRDMSSTQRVSYLGRLEGPQSHQDYRRNVKKLWNETVYNDPEMSNFLQNDLVFAHVVGEYNRVSNQNDGGILLANWIAKNAGSLVGSKDEISTFPFTKQEFEQALREEPLKNKLVLVLSGRPTLMTRSDAETELTGTATPEIRRYYESSGLRKRPGGYYGDVNPETGKLEPEWDRMRKFILSKEDFENRSKDYCEAVISNWKIDYVVDTRVGVQPISHYISRESVLKAMEELKQIISDPLTTPAAKLIQFNEYIIQNPLYAFNISKTFSDLSELGNISLPMKRVDENGQLVDETRYSEMYSLLKEYFTLVKTFVDSLYIKLPPVPGSEQTESSIIGPDARNVYPKEKFENYKYSQDDLDKVANSIKQKLNSLNI